MRKIHNQNFAPLTQNEGGPVRKLAAAARAVMEPVECRLMQSVSPATVLNQQVAPITAKLETQATTHAGDSAHDAAVWVNPTDASQSLIIGTDKQGGLNVYNLSGKVVSSLSVYGYSNVDLRSGFTLGGKSVVLVAATNVSRNKISLLTLDPASKQLTYVASRDIFTSIGGTVNGLTMYHSADTGKTYAIVSNTTGGVEQFELSDNGAGRVNAKSVRTLQVGSDVEGLVADDDNGALYLSEKNVGIWKYGAEPTNGSVRAQVDSVGSSGHLSDAEGLTLYKSNDGSGYLIAASAGSSDYVVYDRTSGAYVTRFKVTDGALDGTHTTAGIEAVSVNLGGSLSEGAFIAQDSSHTNGNDNFKIVSWGDIARAQAIPLAINSAQNPTVVSNPIDTKAVTTTTTTTTSTTTTATNTAPTATSTATFGVDSLALYQANTNNKLVTLTDGITVSLSDFSGTKLNVRAAIHGSVQSVKFGVNANSSYHIENISSYDLAGTGGVWTPTAGTYTLTATAYSADNAKGTVSSTYSVTFTVVDNGSTTDVGTVPAAVTAPASITKLVATASSPAQVTLTWTAGDDSADGFRVESSTDGGKTYKQIAIVTSPSYSNTNLTIGTTYTYRVTAFNTAGSASGVIASATAVTLELPPVVPPLNTTRPSATNTGVNTSATFKSVSGLSVTSGSTYTNLKISGQVSMTGLHDISFINCVFDGGGTAMWNIRCDNATNILIQNCEIKGATAAGIYGSGFKAINNFIHQIGGDGIKPGADCLIQGNYFTQLGWNAPDAHADGIQMSGGSNVHIIGNYFDMPEGVANTKSNTALFIQYDVSNVTFDKNWVRGGNFAMHIYSDLAGGNATIKITNNVYYTGSAQFGFAQIGTGVVWSGNVTDTGLVALTSTK